MPIKNDMLQLAACMFLQVTVPTGDQPEDSVCCTVHRLCTAFRSRLTLLKSVTLIFVNELN